MSVSERFNQRTSEVIDGGIEISSTILPSGIVCTQIRAVLALHM